MPNCLSNSKGFSPEYMYTSHNKLFNGIYIINLKTDLFINIITDVEKNKLQIAKIRRKSRTLLLTLQDKNKPRYGGIQL